MSAFGPLPHARSCAILSRLKLTGEAQETEPAAVVAIVGPTGVGKTAVAVELVSLVGGEIVSADSMAVYVGMDIGTAKPTREEQSRARFHLIDAADPAKPFSVGEFEKLASEAIDDVARRNPPAIVVGGSGLYVRAAIDGLSELTPPDNPEFRRRLVEEARTYGAEYIHRKLAEVDPQAANNIHPNNVKRVMRALEIFEATGIPASIVFERDSNRPPRRPNARFFGLTMSRARLYERIERRVDEMIRAGLVEEVSRLVERGLDADLPSMQGLGYKEVAAYVRGDCGLEEAINLLKKNTRRFAKRQYTWFRADPRIRWIEVEGRSPVEVSRTIQGELIR